MFPSTSAITYWQIEHEDSILNGNRVEYGELILIKRSQFNETTLKISYAIPNIYRDELCGSEKILFYRKYNPVEPTDSFATHDHQAISECLEWWQREINTQWSRSVLCFPTASCD